MFYNQCYSEEPLKVDKSMGIHGIKSDPLANLAKQMGGSKRNSLLKWCQSRIATYSVSIQSYNEHNVSKDTSF